MPFAAERVLFKASLHTKIIIGFKNETVRCDSLHCACAILGFLYTQKYRVFFMFPDLSHAKRGVLF